MLDSSKSHGVLTALHGRDVELNQLRVLLERNASLITITGAPGVGKSRLARELAGQDWSPRRVHWIALGAATSLQSMLETTAQTLGLGMNPEATSSAAVESIGRGIAALGPSLLVLDNFEGLVHSGSPALLSWLPVAKACQWVVTSRHRLEVPGEQCYELRALSTTASSGPSDAARLFMERSAEVLTAGQLPDGSLPVVESLVQRVEGLPLAIELLAAAMDLMTPQQLLARLDALDDDKEAGDAGAAGSTVRGWTRLEQAIDWSWAQLTEHEKQILGHAAAFPGGFPLEHLEAMVHALKLPTISLLGSLRGRSLVARDHSITAGPVRLRVYRTIQNFVRNKLGEEEHALIARRFAEFYARQARQWLRDDDEQRCASRRRLIADDIANLQHALAWWCRGQSQTADAREAALWLSLAIDLALYPLGQLDAVEQALKDCGLERGFAGLTNRDICVRAWRCAARIARRRGHLKRAAELLAEASKEATGVQLATVQAEQAGLAWLLGDRASATRYLNAASQSPAESVQAQCELVRGNMAYEGGELELAQSILESACERAEKANRPILFAATGTSLARTLERRGLLEEAYQWLHQALRIHQDFRVRHLESFAQLALGELALSRRQPEEASHCFRRALALAEGSLPPGRGARYLALEAIACLDARQTPRAVSCLKAARARLPTTLNEQDRLAMTEVFHVRVAEVYQAWLTGELEALPSIVARLQAVAEGAQGSVGLAIALAMSAASMAACGQPEQATQWINELTTRGLDPGDGWRVSMQATQAFMDWAETPWRDERSPPTLEQALAKRVRGLLEIAHKSDATCAVSPFNRWVELRMIQRLFLARLPEEKARTWLTEVIDPRRRALVISIEAEHFRPPKGDWIDLSRRHKLRRLLLALTRCRTEKPRTKLSVDELITILWPDETMVGNSGRDRVYQTIRLLRGAGLADQLTQDDIGYQLNEQCEVIWLASYC